MSSTLERIPPTYIAVLIPVAAAINIVGGYIVTALHLPVFLDMIGTCVVAWVLGPWWGVLTGVVTNLGLALLVNPVYLPFAACNAIGALVWGYGLKIGLTKDFPRLLLLGIISAFVITSMAVPIYVFVFGGATGHFADIMTAVYLQMGAQLWVAVFSSNILSSLADKILAVFLAVPIVQALPPMLRYRVEITKQPPMKVIMYTIIGLVIGVALAAGFVIISAK